MEKRRIGIDIDEVLADFMTELNRFYNQRYGTNFSIEDYKNYDLEKIWGGSKKDAVEIVNDFYESNVFLNILPVEGAQEGIKVLSIKNNLIAITSRPQFIKEKTEKWMRNYFGGDISEIIFTGQYNLHSSLISKASICLDRQISVLVEDNLKVAKECSEKGIMSFILDRGKKSLWNRFDGDDKGMIRVNSWSEIIEALK